VKAIAGAPVPLGSQRRLRLVWAASPSCCLSSKPQSPRFDSGRQTSAPWSDPIARRFARQCGLARHRRNDDVTISPPRICQEDANPNWSSNRCPGALKVTKLATAVATATDARISRAYMRVMIMMAFKSAADGRMERSNTDDAGRGAAAKPHRNLA
jgi:hypothetical protein